MTPRRSVPASQRDFFDRTIGSIPGRGALDRQAREFLADQAARDRIWSDLDWTLFVQAAAGAGKTTELVRRMVALRIGAGEGSDFFWNECKTHTTPEKRTVWSRDRGK